MSHRRALTRQRVGRVSIFEHHGSWYTYHTARGGPVRRRVEGGRAQAEYEASLLNARLVATDAKLDIPAASASDCERNVPGTAISDLREKFLYEHEHVLGSAVATVARYRSATAYLQSYATEQGWDAGAINVGEFVEHLRRSEIAPNGHRNAAKRRLRDKGVVYILETFRSMYHFGIRHELLPPSLMNPFTRFGLARVRVRDAKPIFVFDETQELSFLSSSTRWAFAIHFTLAKTGLRPGELCHLLIEDVDLGGGWLKVCGKPELGWSVKTGRDRRVPLISEVVAVLRRVIGSRTEGAVFLREKFDPARPTAVIGGRSLLANVARHRLTRLQAELGRTASRSEEATCLRTVWRDAGAVDLDRVRASFIATASRAALPSAATCPKSWRHTFATLMQQANVDPLVRQETLGHKPATSDASTLGMTSVYTHTPPTFQKSEIERAMSFRPHVLVLAVKFAALNTTGTEVSHVTH